MARHPFLVECCWNVVDTFVSDLTDEKSGLCWTERDMQAELVGRLRDVMRHLGRSQLNHPDGKAWGVWTTRPRVCCEPKVSYVYDGELAWLYPDIVVWDDSLVVPTESAKLLGSRGGLDLAVLWACELKYHREDPERKDVEKLRLLVEQGILRSGCWLDVRFGTGPKRWDRDESGSIWSYHVELPAQAPGPNPKDG